jgi:hypothetical protein
MPRPDTPGRYSPAVSLGDELWAESLALGEDVDDLAPRRWRLDAARREHPEVDFLPGRGVGCPTLSDELPVSRSMLTRGFQGVASGVGGSTS